VTKEEAEKWMIQEGIALFFETSAKTAQNVCQAFDEIGKQLFMNKLEKRRETFSPMKTEHGKKIILSDEKKEEKSTCC
jgi:hypothetical protein